MGNTFTIAAAVALALALIATGEAAAQKRGKLIRVEKPGELTAKPGDLLQVVVATPSGADKELTDLKFELSGSACEYVTVVKTSERGAAQMSLFLLVKEAGKAVVRVTPVGEKGALGKTFELKVTAQ